MSAADKQQLRAIAVWRALANNDLQPILTCNGHPNRGLAEYDVVVGGSDMVGVLHEHIEQVRVTAEEHGGRMWLDPSGKLCVVWPLERKPGPAGSDRSSRQHALHDEAARAERGE